MSGLQASSASWQINFARGVILRAEAVLGPLNEGQSVDLLLDNCDWIRTCEESRHLVRRARSV